MGAPFSRTNSVELADTMSAARFADRKEAALQRTDPDALLRLGRQREETAGKRVDPLDERLRHRVAPYIEETDMLGRVEQGPRVAAIAARSPPASGATAMMGMAAASVSVADA